MSRPSFGREPEQTLCYDCGDTVKLPPGVVYRGMKLCKACFRLRKQQDISTEVVSPMFDDVDNNLQRLMENMTGMP